MNTKGSNAYRDGWHACLDHFVHLMRQRGYQAHRGASIETLFHLLEQQAAAAALEKAKSDLADNPPRATATTNSGNAMTDDADAKIAKLQANLTSAIEGQRIALERLRATEQLAAERLEGLLAAAAFATILAKQLKLET